jgi:hypothetical protein
MKTDISKETADIVIKETANTVVITVDHSVPYGQRLVRGRFHYCDEDIFWLNPLSTRKGAAEYEFKLFCFDRVVSDEIAAGLISQVDLGNPWKPADWELILAFAEKIPEEQIRYPIVGLGQQEGVAEDLSPVFLLSHFRVYGARTLSILSRKRNFNPVTRFLAARQISSVEPSVSPVQELPCSRIV